MTGNNRKPRADGRRQPANPEQVNQQAHQSQAKAAPLPDQHAVSERRPTLHLKKHPEEGTSSSEPILSSPKPS